MRSSKKIKLIYDFYENNIAYAYDGFNQETKIDNDFDYNKILLDSTNDIIYDKNRNLIIYSWGIYIKSNIFEKQKAAKEIGYNYEIWVYDSKGIRVEKY